MNTLPHIGATLTGSRALSHYTQLAEQARLERERSDEIAAALQVDALIERVRVSPQFVATHDEEFEAQSVSEGVLYACCLLIAVVMILAGVLS